jgi:hypothetical protein
MAGQSLCTDIPVVSLPKMALVKGDEPCTSSFARVGLLIPIPTFCASMFDMAIKKIKRKVNVFFIFLLL